MVGTEFSVTVAVSARAYSASRLASVARTVRERLEVLLKSRSSRSATVRFPSLLIAKPTLSSLSVLGLSLVMANSSESPSMSLAGTVPTALPFSRLELTVKAMSSTWGGAMFSVWAVAIWLSKLSPVLSAATEETVLGF